jgi:DNA-binding MarR family transcriptional regulator
MSSKIEYFGMFQTEANILSEIKRLGATYRSEIAKNLNIDKLTVDRWVQRLVAGDHIEKIDLTQGPETHIIARLGDLKAKGMKENHFKNAVWYRVKES